MRSLRPAWEAAVDALRLDPARARASLLCVASGAAVIVALVSIVTGGRREMLRAVEAAGPSNVFLRARRTSAGGTTGRAGMTEVRSPGTALTSLTTAELRTGQALFSSRAGTAVRISTADLRAGALHTVVPLYAVDGGIGDVFSLRTVRGRLLGELDFRQRSRCALLGASLARRLETEGNPIGRTLEVNAETYQIVGTLRSLPTDAGAGTDLAGIDWDRGLLVPLGAEPQGGGAPDEDYPVDLAVLHFRDPAQAARAARVLKSHYLEESRTDFAVTTPSQAIAQYRAAHRSFDRVALLVSVLCTASAAFGVTNLLRASVRARASEIGIRRAVGARQSDIRRQFLLEGLLLGTGGGLLGILVGAGASLTLLARAGWHPGFDLLSLLVMTAGSAVFGVVSGLSPATEAARLDPGVALRIE